MIENKLLVGEKVYIRLLDINNVIPINAIELEDYVMLTRNSREFYNDIFVPEEDYNTSVVNNGRYYKYTQGKEEITKVSSLSTTLKQTEFFKALSGMFMPPDVIEARYGYDAVKEAALKSVVSTEYFDKEMETLNNKDLFNIDRLRELGLDVQYITEVSPEGRVGLDAYVVGEGFFYHLFFDDNDYRDEKWETATLTENGDIRLERDPIDTLDEEKIIKRHGNRDFRKYSVFENIIWCLKNCNHAHDWADELTIIEDGIYCPVNIDLLSIIINPRRTCSGRYYFEGAVEFNTKEN